MIVGTLMRGTCLCAGLSIGASSLTGQAICSAPHSSPSLAGGGSLGTLYPGNGWLQVSAYRQTSDGFFDSDGDRRGFVSGGEFRNNSAYLTGAIGVFRGIDIWAQVPLHDVRFADANGESTASGGGDPRFAVRVSPALVGLDDIPVTVRGGLKLPGREFPVDALVIPLGEGQRDWELSVESGYAFDVAPIYIMGWAGHRWRENNTAVDFQPGDEFFGHTAVGGWAGPVRGELALEGLWGATPSQLGVALPGARRRLLQFQPTVGVQFGRHGFDFTALVPLVGRNLSYGAGFSLAYRISWGAPPTIDLQELFGEMEK